MDSRIFERTVLPTVSPLVHDLSRRRARGELDGAAHAALVRASIEDALQRSGGDYWTLRCGADAQGAPVVLVTAPDGTEYNPSTW